MDEVSAEAVAVHARFGAVRPFLFAASDLPALADQAGALFDAVSGAIKEAGGWLIEKLIRGGTRQGFVELATDRDRGLMAWESLCPAPARKGRAALLRPNRLTKKPHTMLVYGEYPCWACQGHIYTIDLFNAANELMLPDRNVRLWALMPYPPGFRLPDPVWSRLIEASAIALDGELGFGGVWTAAATAYVFPDTFKPLDGSIPLAGMVYPHMVLRRERLPADAMERLRRPVRLGSRSWTFPILEEFGEGRFVMVSTATDYGDENCHLGRALASVVGRPYVGDVLSRSG